MKNISYYERSIFCEQAFNIIDHKRFSTLKTTVRNPEASGTAYMVM